MPDSSKPQERNFEEPVAMSAVYVSFVALQAHVRHELTGEQIEATLAPAQAEALLEQLKNHVRPAEGPSGGQSAA